VSGPVQGRERAPALDVLRGFALLGIVVVNLRFLREDFTFVGDLGAANALADRVADGVVIVLAEARFYPLFSFLFGYGFAVQAARAARAERSFVPQYLRRSAGLFVLGVLHAALLFSGDILAAYAILGLALLSFRHVSERAVLVWAVALWLLSGLVYALSVGATFASGDPTGVAPDAFDRAYAEGSFGDVVLVRLAEWGIALLSLPFIGGAIVAAFLVGHLAARHRLLVEPERHRALLRRLVVVGLPVGLVGGTVHVLTLDRFAASSGAEVGLLLGATGLLHQLVGPFLTAAYVGLLALAVAAGRQLRYLAAAGRLALTNYLSQSLVLSLVFAGYGLGFYGEVGASGPLLLGIALWSAQLALSVLWLSAGFAFGPVEWVLRWWTYGTRPSARAHRQRQALRDT
jgi:uncharacterized protein